ncbi:MAG: YHS domain-containing protein [Anaerolineales bacterium]|nr:YHS domain-containing protein [Anaerolineales bacterium]
MIKTYIDFVCGVIMTHRTVFAQSKYNGQTYYFCSKGDKEVFDHNPPRYIMKFSKELMHHHSSVA